ncbi:MAG: transglutaminase domain-containing protein [Oscillospiraceae bacterium]|nr:transglutaminase domain-containing protein [Oscillospiraceae bacterium]
MKKILSIFSSTILAILVAITGIVNCFAVVTPDNYLVKMPVVSSDNENESEEPAIPYFPEITGFENTADGTKVSWSEFSGAASYLLYVLNGTEWECVGESTSLSYTHTSLENGTTYIYTVRALDENYNFIGSYSTQGYENTFYAPPVISSLENTFGGVRVKWNKVSGINIYRIFRKTKNTGWMSIGDTDDTSYIDKNVTSGVNYTYTVRGLDSKGEIVSYYNNGKKITYVKAPSISRIENTATGSKISWTKCNGATKYRVYYLGSNKKWKILGTTASTSITHNKLKTGTTYTYTVRCLDSKGKAVSGFNNNGKSNLFLVPPKISSITKKNNGNLIQWKNVSGAAGYRIYRKTFGTSWKILADITSRNSYVDNSAMKNKVYSYTLRCVDKNGKNISYFISNTRFYRNGSLANCIIKVGKNKYCLKNGVRKTGLQKISGNKYYFGSSGVLQKNGIVGSKKVGWYYADKKGKIDPNYCNGISHKGKDWNVINGKATKVSSRSDRTLFRALKIVAKITNKNMSKSKKLKVCYDYVKNSYTELNPRIPHYTGNDWPILYANDMFVDGAGNCFSYASAFAYMAKGIGYKNVYCCSSGGHGWAEINGLVYDPEWSRHHTREYYALSYETKLDQNYKGAIAPGYSWMHVKI